MRGIRILRNINIKKHCICNYTILAENTKNTKHTTNSKSIKNIKNT